MNSNLSYIEAVTAEIICEIREIRVPFKISL